MKQRIISLLLVVCMVMTLLPAGALAANGTTGKTEAETGRTAEPFADVPSDSWYASAVRYVCANGFFNGTSATTFAPEGNMTRAMFVTVLGRMAGVDPADYPGTDFTDVQEGLWYAPYVKWAAQYGITTGTGGGRFSPDALITREQMAVFFVRYFEKFGVRFKTEPSVTTQPADLERVSSWARDAVLQLWALGLLNGDGVSFNPGDNAARCQTAALCQRADLAVETWYTAPGVESSRVSVDPDAQPAEENKPSGTGSGNGAGSGGSSSGDTKTTYYEVSFALGEKVSQGEVTLPNRATYPAGTKISSIPTPTQQDGVFLGWYYDAAMTRLVGADATVDRSMTLYAKMGQVLAVNANEQETPNYVTVTVPAAEVDGYTFTISGYAEDCILSFLNVTANNAEMKNTAAESESYRYTVSGSAVRPKLAPGQTYRVELEADSAACFVVNGEAQAQSVRVLNIITEKGQVDRLTLNSGVRFIPKAQVEDLGELDGLFQLTLKQDGTGDTNSIQKAAQKGAFTYKGEVTLAVGDTVAIYEGKHPEARTDAALGKNDGDNGTIAYVEIIGIQGDRYSYKTADSEDVLFTPDVLPVRAAADKDPTDGSVLTVEQAELTFTDDKYAVMGLDSQTTVDVGDFLAIYQGETPEQAMALTYGRITQVETTQADGVECYVLTYETAAEAEVLAAMDLYNTRQEQVELTQQQKAEIEQSIEAQAMESGFVEEASRYLAALALETDGFRELSDDLDMELSAYSVTYADGTPVEPGEMALMSGKAKITDKKVEATVAAGHVLQHFEDGWGVRVELALGFTVDVGGKLEIKVQAVFEQEVLITINTSGGAIWKWKWIFPYIYDYQLNANIDLGTYTGIGITATAKTVGEEDDEFDWAPVTGSGAENKIINIGKQITELMEKKEEFLGEKLVDENGNEVEWNGTNGGGLADKYSAMMEEADDSWIELFRREIFSKEGPVDRLHILVYGISADFVVSANVYVTMGLTFSYSVAKRYNFSLQLFHKKATNQTIDLEEANYNFDFYVMGTLGIRAGVEFEIGIGLFSLKLDSIGITAETGAYARLWGYFYYHLSWTKSGGKDSNASGAMLVEIGLYLKITFKAQLFSNEKLTYQPTLYENEWPLWSAGAQENVYGFFHTEEDYDMTLTGQRTAAFPQELFYMCYMDMKTGEQYGVLDDAGQLEDESKPAKLFAPTDFTFTFTNPKFRYDPNTNTITVSPGYSTAESCDVIITWKNAALAFTSKPISRTLHIDWDDPKEARYIAFDTRGGSAVKAISLVGGAPIPTVAKPTKQGYTFAWWTTDEAGRNGYTIPSRMPESFGNGANGITIYAQWTPRSDTKYTVEHYQQALNGSYVLKDTETLTGTTEAQTAAAARTYPGFQLKKIQNETIMPDGSTVAKVYYDRETYLVTFDYAVAGMETSSMVYRVKYEGTIYPPRLTLGGYEFAGYAELTQAQMNAGLQITKAATYHAQWTPRDDTPYRVEHYTQSADGRGYLLLGGDSAIESRTGTTGGRVSVKSLLRSAEGLTPVKASADGTELHLDNGQFIIGADGKTVVKLYYDRKSYRLTLDAANGTPSATEEKLYDLKITLPTPEKQGYTFAGWYNGETPMEQQFRMPAENVALTAHWTANTDTKYTVEHYDQNADGTYPAKPSRTETLTGTTAAQVTAEAKALEHYHADEDNSSAVLTGTVAADGSLVLKRYYARDTFALTFVNGEQRDTDTKRWGAAIVVPSLKKTGYTLSWDKEIPAAMPTEDSTFTAVWTVKQYTLTFNTDGGSEIAPITQDYGTAVTAPADPTRTGYTFSGWDKAIPETMPAENTTITARWSVNRYTITFNTDGGSAVSAITKNYGAAVSAPTAPTKTGYTFAGWQLGDEAYTFSTMPAESITLTARWTARDDTEYTVKHYLQNADNDEYRLQATETLSGTTGAATAAAAKDKAGDYAHFTAKAFEQGVIAADGKTVVEIYYDRDTFTVTFDANGGTVDGAKMKTFRFGQTLTLATPSNGDYAFGGWFTEEACTTAAPAAMPAEDLNLFAKWVAGEVNYYVLRYEMDLNGEYQQVTTGSGSATGLLGSKLKLSSLKENKEGFTFVRATQTLAGGTETELSGTSVAVAKEMTVKLYYSRNRYTLKWDLNAGTGVEGADYSDQQVYYGAPITPPATPTRSTYIFKGWRQLYASSAPAPETMPAEDMTLYALWERAKHAVIGIDDNDGTEYRNWDIEIGKPQTVAVTADRWPKKTGYDFLGWTVVGVDGTPDSVRNIPAKDSWTNEEEDLFDFVMPDNDVIITRNWKAHTYDVVFDSNGGTGRMGSIFNIKYDETKTLPKSTFTREGYQFTGWRLWHSLSGDFYEDEAEIKNLTAQDNVKARLYAQWEAEEHTITFDQPGYAPITAKTDESITPPDDPVKTGYRFTGWQGDDEKVYQKDALKRMPGKDLNLTALWNPLTYTITYTGMDGAAAGENTPRKHTYGTETVVPNPSKTGYAFAGWRVNGGTKAVKELTLGATDYTADITLEATWTAGTYSVHFDANASDATGTMADQEFAFGETKKLSANRFTRTGYQFLGWNTTPDKTGLEADYANMAEYTLAQAENVTLYAHWYLTAYGVKYELNGGTMPEAGCPDSYTVESEDASLSDPTKAGYTFAGWYTTSTFAAGTEITKLPGDHAENLTLYAKWEELVYTITYNLGDAAWAKHTNPTTVRWGESFMLKPASQAGYIFLGWKRDNTAESVVIPGSADAAGVAETPVDDVTYYAAWEHPKYTVTFINGHTQIAQEENYYGRRVDWPTMTAPDGLRFLGWRDGRNSYESVYDFSVPEGDVTLYAVWGLADIYNEEDFAKAVELSQEYDYRVTAIRQTVCLHADITVAAGTQLNLSSFQGTFDGGNHTITVSGSTGMKPLFGDRVALGCTIKNVNIAFAESTITVTADEMLEYDNERYWGVFTGRVEPGAGTGTGAVLENCSVISNSKDKSVSIQITPGMDSNLYIGTIAGLSGGIMINCRVGRYGAGVMLTVNGNGTTGSNDHSIGVITGYNYGVIRYNIAHYMCCNIVSAGKRREVHVGGFVGGMGVYGSITFESGTNIAIECSYKNNAQAASNIQIYAGWIAGVMYEGTTLKRDGAAIVERSGSDRISDYIGHQYGGTVTGFSNY
ncbi:MAG: InlB B-repeat-containing protein [Clostridia bacterium]|nr:InlB B-repeat-containing protein [Clostridia bacterium]